MVPTKAKFLYDSHGRTISKTDALTNTTSLAYDVLGRLSSVPDPRGRITTYAYNGFGELLTLVSPDTGTTTHTYDGIGRRATTTDARGQLVTFGYDALSRPTSATASGQVHTFTWDTCTNGMGRLCQATDPTGSASYTYTDQGQLASHLSMMPAGGSATHSYVYDDAGRMTGIGYPGGVGVGYGYLGGALRAVTITLSGTPTTLLPIWPTCPLVVHAAGTTAMGWSARRTGTSMVAAPRSAPRMVA